MVLLFSGFHFKIWLEPFSYFGEFHLNELPKLIFVNNDYNQ